MIENKIVTAPFTLHPQYNVESDVRYVQIIKMVILQRVF